MHLVVSCQILMASFRFHAVICLDSSVHYFFLFCSGTEDVEIEVLVKDYSFSEMLDWLSLPSSILQNAGGSVSWFLKKKGQSFSIICTRILVQEPKSRVESVIERPKLITCGPVWKCHWKLADSWLVVRNGEVRLIIGKSANKLKANPFHFSSRSNIYNPMRFMSLFYISSFMMY